MDVSYGDMIIYPKEPQYAPNRFKILVIGRKGSGRSALVRRFKLNVFEDQKDEITLPEITVIVRAVEGHIIKADFEIMELSKFLPDDDPSSPAKMHNAHHHLDVNGVLLVYDITNMDSYREICDALPVLQHMLAPDVDISFVGTKSDLKEAREVPFEDAEKKSQQLEFSLFETRYDTPYIW
ncbi:Miro-like protein [Oesophagostomum dentatum]|uniref:Miro-like protein n=1 Tax=Oesophagostomum dentatum TaxID=61180 RepID=A0A0B1THW7_OESDE|nr:Miro-like protein [Oesophagostomum dentatum]